MLPRWFILSATFIVNGQVWGNLVAFSVFYSYLRDQSPQHEMHVSLIGSILFGATTASTLLMAPLMRRIRLRWLYVGMLVLYTLGPLMSAFVTDVRFWYLTYTLPIGFGGAGMFILSYVTAMRCYPKRACAVSTFVSAGGSLFSFIIPLLLQLLLKNVGLRYTLLVISGYLFCFLIFAPVYPNETTPTESFAEDVSEEINIDAVYSIKVKSVKAARGQLKDVKSSPNHSIKSMLLSRDYLIWLFAAFILNFFNSIAYIHLTNYTKYLLTHPLATPMFFMITFSLGSLTSKIISAVLVEKYKFPIFLAFQLTLITFGLALSLLGVLHHFTSVTAILVALFIATFLLGCGEGTNGSLPYPATYETCKPHTDPIFFCLFCAVVSVPMCISGFIGTALYQFTKSYPLVFFVAGTGHLVSCNILWFTSQTDYFRQGRKQRSVTNGTDRNSSSMEEPLQTNSLLMSEEIL